VSKNWDWTVRDFNRTLASIYNQTNPNFRILVGCHDIPELLIPTDERLEFIQARTPPADPPKPLQDKSQKLRCLGEYFRQIGGRWFMVLDADDLISARLVEFVLANPNPNGFIARHGYFLDEVTQAIVKIPDRKVFDGPYDQIAGCAVLHFKEGDFAGEDEDYSRSRFARYAAFADHRLLWEMSIKEQRPLIPFPFSPYVYVLNTGENHSFNYGDSRKWRKERLIPALRANATIPNASLLDEFALRHPLWKVE
jgi:hypothetical protein